MPRGRASAGVTRKPASRSASASSSETAASGDAVRVPDAEADVRLLRQVARDAQGLAGIAWVRSKELDQLASLRRGAPRAEAVCRLELPSALPANAHVASWYPKGGSSQSARRFRHLPSLSRVSTRGGAECRRFAS